MRSSWCHGRVDVPVAPNDHGMLDVDADAAVYWEQWGASEGVPAVYLHGGPGGGLGTSQYRTRFDLSRTRVVGIDQRGCGRSVPHAADPRVSLSGNTTTQLIADLERVREHLGIEAWVLSGASWGSTLALAYAQAHPDRVLGVVLYAVTTTSRCEVDWVTEGVQAFFPEAWDRLASHAEAAGLGYRRGHGRLVEAYAQLLDSADLAVRDAASQEWALWEDTHISIGLGGFRRDTRWEDPRFRHAFARLTTHYWSHDGFCDPPIVEQMHRLTGIPGVLIHGRRDISSPAAIAWELHRRWHGSTLHIDDSNGHGGSSMAQTWRAAHDELTTQLRH